MLNGYHLTIELLNSPDGSGIPLKRIKRTAGTGFPKTHCPFASKKYPTDAFKNQSGITITKNKKYEKLNYFMSV